MDSYEQARRVVRGYLDGQGNKWADELEYHDTVLADTIAAALEEKQAEIERLRAALPAPDALNYAATILEQRNPGGQVAGMLRESAKLIREILDA